MYSIKAQIQNENRLILIENPNINSSQTLGKFNCVKLKFVIEILVYPTSMPLPPVSLGDSTPPAPPSLQSPMANLMSITETLPPGSPRSGPSPPGPPPPRTASRGSQHSPNSSGK